MSIYLTKYFGKIELSNLEEYHEAEIELNEKPIKVVINTDNSEDIDQISIKAIDDYIDHFRRNEEEIRTIIQENFKALGEAKNYIDFQIEGQDDSDISNLIAYTDQNLNKEEKLLSILHLLQVNFYPDKADNVFAVYDYTIGEDLTDDLLVVIVSKDSKITLTIES